MFRIKLKQLFKQDISFLKRKLSSDEDVYLFPSSGVLLNAVLSELSGKKILIITDSKEEALILSKIADNSLLNPEFGIYPYENDVVSFEDVYRKIKFLERFYNDDSKIVISSLKGLFDFILPADRVGGFSIEVGEKIGETKLINTLSAFGYNRVKEISDKGEFSVKGDIVDFYPPLGENPLRIDFDEDTVEKIKYIDLETMRSVGSLKNVNIYPISYFKLSEQDIEKIRSVMKGKVSKKDAYLWDSVMSDMEKMREFGNIGVNYYPFYLFNKGKLGYPSLVDFSDQFVKIFYGEVDFERFLKETKETYEKSVEAKEIVYLNIGKAEEAANFLKQGKRIFFEGLPSENSIDLDIKEIPENFTALYSFKEIILSTLKEKSVLIVSQQFERVKELLSLYDIVPEANISDKKGVYLINGFLEKGIETDNYLILTDRELFPHYKIGKTHKKVVFSKEISSIEELSVGDYVVHKDFGIGLFEGLKRIEQNGVEKEFLLIQYRDGEKLYVPLERIGLVQRYIGDRRIVALNRLHGTEWEKTKKKAAESARLLAMKMLRVEAERKIKGGFPFKPFVKEEKILALSFPYEFTEDQQKAMEDVFRDMEKPLPMDRLICGDVGYGKTEIAIRAAFRAVMNGKQVAFLVPTTVLALQHERTLKERLHLFPVEIGMLSRFTPAKQVKEILKKLKNGTLDIVIGTHRILSKDVKFKDLGLLIIDEEQKFGVKDKEKIKQLKANIDVLTLTATPIPRTLHTALVNLKSISMINTPPPGRLPVKTFVSPFNWNIVKKAIEFELSRNGQVFIVHNRIESIYSFAEKVRAFVPNAKVAVAHGKMDKTDLEEVMLSFYEGKIDVLVSTTIIENGIDIPTVNTLIVDAAENFGLSQMYQLRGRIGRSHLRAFAYFLFTPNKGLRAISEERLRTIEEFTGVGAGIKIAMKDLELRGAGNILGKEQHGHIVSVGYNLYVSLLEEAVAELRGEKKPEIKDVLIRVNENYFIPQSFVPLNSERMDYYRRITNAIDTAEIDRIRDELFDRFGKIPKEVENLLSVGKCYAVMREIGVKEIFQENKRIFFTIDKQNRISPEGLQKLLMNNETVRIGKDYLSFETNGRNVIEQIYIVLNTIGGKVYV